MFVPLGLALVDRHESADIVAASIPPDQAPDLFFIRMNIMNELGIIFGGESFYDWPLVKNRENVFYVHSCR
jgi:hypothetical protein